MSWVWRCFSFPCSSLKGVEDVELVDTGVPCIEAKMDRFRTPHWPGEEVCSSIRIAKSAMISKCMFFESRLKAAYRRTAGRWPLTFLCAPFLAAQGPHGVETQAFSLSKSEGHDTVLEGI